MREYEQIDYGPVTSPTVRMEPLPSIARLQRRIEELERENEALRARLAATHEACAVIADEIEEKHWHEYKHGHGPGRADPHFQGMSHGAARVAAAIRARGTK